jgi:GGDEF domain-containing protein
VIAPGGTAEAADRVKRIQTWVLGEYRVGSGSQTAKVTVNASVGAVPWERAETAEALLSRADKNLYSAKNRSKSRVPVQWS